MRLDLLQTPRLVLSPAQGPHLLQLLLPRMLGAAACGEDTAQAAHAQHQVQGQSRRHHTSEVLNTCGTNMSFLGA